MKKIVFLLALLGLAAGPVFGKDYELSKKADDYSVLIKIDKNPPVAGDNGMTLEIKDGAGKIVTDAKVKLDYGMPAMPGMPAMFYKADAELKGNEYKAKMNFSMAGSWNVTVQITQGDKVRKAKFTVDAH
jgi:hypothetical protein